MALHILYSGSVAKHPETPDDNEDVHDVSTVSGRLVLSDGASESFDARGWAQLLVRRAAEDALTVEGLDECIACYNALHDPAALSWSKAAAFERGSFATLLLARDNAARQLVRVESIGDSLACWVHNTTLVATLPYAHSDEFARKPTLLASRAELNGEAMSSLTAAEWGYGGTGEHLLVCMTDALGAWLLRQQEMEDSAAIEVLCSIREHGELLALVERERAAGRMRRDDSTLIVAKAQVS